MMVLIYYVVVGCLGCGFMVCVVSCCGFDLVCC